MAIHEMPKAGTWGDRMGEIFDVVQPGDTIVVYYVSQRESIEQALRTVGIEGVTVDYRPLPKLTLSGEITPEQARATARRIVAALTGKTDDADTQA